MPDLQNYGFGPCVDSGSPSTTGVLNPTNKDPEGVVEKHIITPTTGSFTVLSSISLIIRVRLTTSDSHLFIETQTLGSPRRYFSGTERLQHIQQLSSLLLHLE